MIIRREWIVVCACPDCGEPMAPLVRIAEQHFSERKEAPVMPEMTFLTPTLMLGVSVTHCDRCGVTHDVAQLAPVLTRVDLGPREV